MALQHGAQHATAPMLQKALDFTADVLSFSFIKVAKPGRSDLRITSEL